MSDKYGYIGIETLLNFCSNQKDHCITPNDFMRMNRVKIDERPHGEWIPCSERLPEKDGKYIVCWCGDWGVDVRIAKYSQCGKYWFDSNGYELRGITAWMPLPEP